MECEQRDFDLRVRWKVNTHKCIDASPLLVKESRPLMGDSDNFVPRLMGGSGIVYVGSHSHQFLAVEVESGRVLWRSKLGGRVESSACPSLCGKYVSVGK